MPSRALGQNFLVDQNMSAHIARLAQIAPGDQVVEIGAGLGSLTASLVDSGAQVTAVELDRHLIPLLTQRVGDAQVRIVQGDAMRLDWDSLLIGGPWVLVANLPYNIATPLILGLLERAPQIRRMLVMVQFEVAERFVAGVGSPSYGAVSVRIANFAKARIVSSVPPDVFHPRPRVGSGLVRLDLLDEAACGGEGVYATLVQIVRKGFGQRRKMLRASLRGLVEESVLTSCGVSPQARAEEVALEQWCALAHAQIERGHIG